jgi:hypothetical protein
VYFVVTETQVEGSTIPEVVAVETIVGEVESVVPLDEAPEGAAPDLEAPIAPGDIEGVQVDVLPEMSMDVVI